MGFCGQLVSLGARYSRGDCGVIDVFICWACLETRRVLQCD